MRLFLVVRASPSVRCTRDVYYLIVPNYERLPRFPLARLAPCSSSSLAPLACALVASLAACSGSNANSVTPHPDAGTPPAQLDGGIDAADAGQPDATPPPVPEPAWSGMTVEPGCTVNGCIHAFAYATAYTQYVAKKYAAPSFNVLNGFAQYTITYVSDGREITGTIFFPDSTPPAGGFSVVVVNQFTSGVGASCAPSVGQLAAGVAGVAALSGYVTLVPDATSYGTAPYGAYLWGKVAGRAALDGARAAFHTSQAFGQAIARKAVIAGLSQGAYSTMAAATEYPSYANELEIRGFAAAEPPSNFRSGANAALTSTTLNVVYDAMRLWSWQGDLMLSGGQIFQPPYDTQIPQWLENDCIYNGADGSSGTLYNMFYEPYPDGGMPTTPIPASAIFSSTFLGYAMNDSWPADWAAAYASAQAIPSGLTLPVLIFEGSADTTVLPKDADAYVAQLKAAGVNVDYRQIPNGTHGTTALSSFTVAQLANDQALAWFASTLAN
jgi:pimeloyl-ACP methyl ester carboxylesterase